MRRQREDTTLDGPFLKETLEGFGARIREGEWLGGVERFQFLEDETCVEVDVAADAEEGDAPVGDAESVDIRTREHGRLEL